MMVYMREAAHEYINVSPMALVCPHCKAKIGEPCVRVGDEMELVHLQRIEAALALDKKRSPKK
jgi:hypothetical protein